MKQKDVAIIIVVAIISGIASFFLANLLFGGEKQYTLQAPVVSEISPNLSTPNSQYFNNNSIDSTKTIKIGDSSNTDPFKSK